MLRYCWFCLVLGYAIMLFGCGGDTPRVQPAGLSALPAPSILLRTASYSELDRQQDGAQYIEDLTNVFAVSEAGTAAEFHPSSLGDDGLHGIAYAGYGFALDGYDGAATVDLGWAEPTPAVGGIWIALANWRTDSWKWTHVNNPNQLSFTPLSDYFEEATGLCYVIVALVGIYEDNYPVLNTIRIGAEIVVQQVPVAVLGADNISGVPPLDVNFDTAQSTDSDGSITLYELDKNGDGTFEDSSATPPAWTQHFNTEGRFSVALRVTDDDGNTDTDQVVVNTAADSGWVGVNIPGVTSPASPVWDADGLPLVVYQQGVNLSCLRAENTLGQTWSAPLDIYYSGNGTAPCAATISGVPALAFETSGANGFNLIYVMAKDAAGTEWNAPYFVCKGPATLQPSGDPQLFELDGHPAIMYQTDASFGARELYCYKANDALGQSWDAGTVIGPDNVVGMSRVRMINQRPAVAFTWRNEAENRYELAFACATDMSATAWGEAVQIRALPAGTPGDVCYGIDLIQAGWLPAVAYCVGPIPNGAKYVMFLTGDDSYGTSWTGAPQWLYTCTGEFDYVKWPRLELIAGSPALLFEEWSPDTFGRLMYMRATNMAASTWSPLEEVARVDAGVTHSYEPYSRYLSLGMSGGLPAVVTTCGTTTTQQSIFYTRR
jgi:PKD repeat protein